MAITCWRKRADAPQLSEQERADRRHKRGWLAYTFASEAWVIVSSTLFLPVALEQYARDNGRALPDLTMPCAASDASDDAGCRVHLGPRWINTTSFSLYTSGVAMGLQVLVVISLAALADRPQYRKWLMLVFGWVGSITALIFFALPSSSKAWPLAIPLAILGNALYGASLVQFNAYLPAISAREPDVLAVTTATTPSADAVVLLDEEKGGSQASPKDGAAPSDKSLKDDPAATEPVLPSPSSHAAVLSIAMARLSTRAVAVGYSAGIVLLVITLIPVILLGGSTLALRIAIGMSGVWWAVGCIPTALWLRGSVPGDKEETPVRVGSEIARAWRELGAMLRPSEARKMVNTFKFLASWFLLSDGLTTITATAILFAKTELHMPSTSLIALGAIVPLAGIFGSFVWPIFQRRVLHWSNKTMIVLLVCLAALLPLYGVIGIPLSRRGVHGGGLTVSGEMYGAAIYFGLLYGPFQGYARAVFGEIIPRSEEARWFALYSITDKSSSFVGPLIVGAIADATNNIRWGFLFLLGMVLVAVPVLLSVDVRRGREDAQRFRRGSA